MYIITEKEHNRILMMGNQLDHMDNGYPGLTEENVAFPTDMVNVYQTEVPDGVEPEKYCYTEESSFYVNPDWKEPNKYGIPDEILKQIQDDTAEIIALEVKSYEY